MKDTRVTRLALIPVIILAGALSWWQELLRGGAGVLSLLDDCWGVFRTSMEVHWRRVFIPNAGDGSLYHRLKNVGAEWADSSNGQPSQRPYKALCWLIQVSWILGLIQGVLLAWLVLSLS